MLLHRSNVVRCISCFMDARSVVGEIACEA
jgi:hypothetical protein